MIWLFVILTAPLYLFRLGSLPFSFHGDEAETALQALQIVSGKVGPIGVGWYNQPLLSFVPHAVSMWIFGHTIVGDRLGSVVFGLASLPFLYLIARELYDELTARFSTLLFGVSHIWIAFSRLGIVYAQAAFFVLACFCFFLAGIRKQSRWLIFLSGIGAGLGMYSYAAGRIAPLIISIFVFALIVKKKAVFPMAWYFLIFILGFALTFFPQGSFYLTHRDAFVGRVSDVYIFSTSAAVTQWRQGEYGDAGVGEILIKQMPKSVNIFRGDGSGQYGIKGQLLDYASLGLLFLGVIATFRRKSTTAMLPLLWFGLTFVLGVVLTTSPIFLPRFVVGLPAVYLFCGLGLTFLWRKVSRFGIAGRLIVLAVVGYIIAFNISRYFFVYPMQLEKGIAGDRSALVATKIARAAVKQKGERDVLCIEPPLRSDFSTLRFLLLNKTVVSRCPE